MELIASQRKDVRGVMRVIVTAILIYMYMYAKVKDEGLTGCSCKHSIVLWYVKQDHEMLGLAAVILCI